MAEGEGVVSYVSFCVIALLFVLCCRIYQDLNHLAMNPGRVLYGQTWTVLTSKAQNHLAASSEDSKVSRNIL